MEHSSKVGLFIILSLIILPVQGQNVNCNGKAFHCVNSTHFKICVDLGGGISKTVDDFLIPCPSHTFCKETNQYECEYQLNPSPVALEQLNEVTMVEAVEATSDVIFNDTVGIMPLFNSTRSELLGGNYNYVSTAVEYNANAINTTDTHKNTFPFTINATNDLLETTKENVQFNLVSHDLNTEDLNKNTTVSLVNSDVTVSTEIPNKITIFPLLVKISIDAFENENKNWSSLLAVNLTAESVNKNMSSSVVVNDYNITTSNIHKNSPLLAVYAHNATTENVNINTSPSLEDHDYNILTENVKNKNSSFLKFDDYNLTIENVNKNTSLFQTVSHYNFTTINANKSTTPFMVENDFNLMTGNPNEKPSSLLEANDNNLTIEYQSKNTSPQEAIEDSYFITENINKNTSPFWNDIIPKQNNQYEKSFELFNNKNNLTEIRNKTTSSLAIDDYNSTIENISKFMSSILVTSKIAYNRSPMVVDVVTNSTEFQNITATSPFPAFNSYVETESGNSFPPLTNVNTNENANRSALFLMFKNTIDKNDKKGNKNESFSFLNEKTFNRTENGDQFMSLSTRANKLKIITEITGKNSSSLITDDYINPLGNKNINLIRNINENMTPTTTISSFNEFSRNITENVNTLPYEVETTSEKISSSHTTEDYYTIKNSNINTMSTLMVNNYKYTTEKQTSPLSIIDVISPVEIIYNNTSFTNVFHNTDNDFLQSQNDSIIWSEHSSEDLVAKAVTITPVENYATENLTSLTDFVEHQTENSLKVSSGNTQPYMDKNDFNSNNNVSFMAIGDNLNSLQDFNKNTSFSNNTNNLTNIANTDISYQLKIQGYTDPLENKNITFLADNSTDTTTSSLIIDFVLGPTKKSRIENGFPFSLDNNQHKTTNGNMPSYIDNEYINAIHTTENVKNNSSFFNRNFLFEPTENIGLNTSSHPLINNITNLKDNANKNIPSLKVENIVSVPESTNKNISTPLVDNILKERTGSSAIINFVINSTEDIKTTASLQSNLVKSNKLENINTNLPPSVVLIDEDYSVGYGNRNMSISPSANNITYTVAYINSTTLPDLESKDNTNQTNTSSKYILPIKFTNDITNSTDNIKNRQVPFQVSNNLNKIINYSSLEITNSTNSIKNINNNLSSTPVTNNLIKMNKEQIFNDIVEPYDIPTTKYTFVTDIHVSNVLNNHTEVYENQITILYLTTDTPLSKELTEFIQDPNDRSTNNSFDNSILNMTHDYQEKVILDTININNSVIFTKNQLKKTEDSQLTNKNVDIEKTTGKNNLNFENISQATEKPIIVSTDIPNFNVELTTMQQSKQLNITLSNTHENDTSGFHQGAVNNFTDIKYLNVPISPLNTTIKSNLSNIFENLSPISLKEVLTEPTINNITQFFFIKTIKNDQASPTIKSPMYGSSTILYGGEYFVPVVEKSSNISNIANISLEKKEVLTSSYLTFPTNRSDFMTDTKGDMISATSNHNEQIPEIINKDYNIIIDLTNLTKTTMDTQDIISKDRREAQEITTSGYKKSKLEPGIRDIQNKSSNTTEYADENKKLNKEIIIETTASTLNQNITPSNLFEKTYTANNLSENLGSIEIQTESVILLQDQSYIDADAETISPQYLNNLENRLAQMVTTTSKVRSTYDGHYLLDTTESTTVTKFLSKLKSYKVSNSTKFKTPQEMGITLDPEIRNSSDLTQVSPKIFQQTKSFPNIESAQFGQNKNGSVVSSETVKQTNRSIGGDLNKLSENKTFIELNNKNIPKIKGPSILSNTVNSTNSIFCLNRPNGKYSDQNNCSKFYICVGKLQPLDGECPYNTVFSDIRKLCTKNLSHCIRNNQFKCIANGRYYDVFLKNTYYICVWNKSRYIKFKFQCQNGFTLNKSTIHCVPDQKHANSSASEYDSTSNKDGNTTKEESSKLKIEFECEREGKFADPNNCNRYFVCTQNNKSEFRRRIKNCEQDEVWHKYKNKCVDEDSYECKVSS